MMFKTHPLHNSFFLKNLSQLYYSTKIVATVLCDCIDPRAACSNVAAGGPCSTAGHCTEYIETLRSGTTQTLPSGDLLSQIIKHFKI